MAGKSPTELIRQLEVEVTTLKTLLSAIEKQIDAVNLLEIRERLAEFGSLLSAISVTSLLTRIATLEEQVAELKKAREENDRRRWQVILLFGGSVLTLLVQIALLTVKR